MDIKNNKRIQYLLLGLVIIIWGLVVWQFYNYTGVERTNYEVATTTLPIQNQSNLEKETFELDFDYQDPFLGKKIRGISTNQSPPTTASRFERAAPSTEKGVSDTAPTKQSPSFPSVIYKGYSLNKQQVSRAFLYINGKSVTLQRGEKHEGMQLNQMTRDSVILFKDRVRKAFFRI